MQLISSHLYVSYMKSVTGWINNMHHINVTYEIYCLFLKVNVFIITSSSSRHQQSSSPSQSPRLSISISSPSSMPSISSPLPTPPSSPSQVSLNLDQLVGQALVPRGHVVPNVESQVLMTHPPKKIIDLLPIVRVNAGHEKAAVSRVGGGGRFQAFFYHCLFVNFPFLLPPLPRLCSIFFATHQ